MSHSSVASSDTSSHRTARTTHLSPIDEVPLPKLQSNLLQKHTQQLAWITEAPDDRRSIDSSTGAARVPVSVLSEVAAELYDVDGGDTDNASPLSTTTPVTTILFTKQYVRRLLLVLLFLGLVIAMVVVVVLVSQNNDVDSANAATPAASPVNATADRRRQVITATAIEQPSVWDDPSSAQVRARDWILTVDTLRVDDGARLLQRYALVLLYFATRGEDWVGGDAFLNPSVSECQWTGVTCDDEEPLRANQVFRLYFQSRNLAGTLPNELGRCIPRLIELGLFNNSLAGTIPAAWFAPDTEWYETLSWLDVSKNQLSGTIPAAIWTLQDLRFLFLNQNQLTGPLEGDDANATTTTLRRGNVLQQVQLYENQLTGSIPPWFSDLRFLEQWIVFENQLTGFLPDPLPMTIFEFDVSFNNISGSIPESFWSQSTSPPSLHDLYLDHNLLTGPLPNTTQLRQDMVHLWLNDNRLTGTIPENFAYVWTRLAELTISHNQLQGRLGPAVAAADLLLFCPPRNDTLWRDVTLLTADCLERVVSDDPPVQCDCCTACLESPFRRKRMRWQ